MKFVNAPAFVAMSAAIPSVATRFPHHEFTHLPQQWWPEATETLEETHRTREWFRRLMAARETAPPHWCQSLGRSFSR